MTDLWQKLQNDSRPIVLYGMGNGAQAVLKQLKKYGKKPVGVFASDAFFRGQQFCGYTVQTYTALSKQFSDMMILVCFGSNRAEVLDNIAYLSSKHTLYCPDVPVYGEQIFDISFARTHAEELKKVYALLGDQASRQTFENIIYFKLSGELRYLQQCEYKKDLFAPIALNDEEIYMDLGAYRGDTVAEFLQKVNDYNKIYALEPNGKTFKKLKENTQGLENILLCNAAVSDTDGTVYMKADGRGTTVATAGNEIAAVTLDTLLEGTPATLIKMDVEGQEAAALNGAKQTIRRWHPKMIVAAYHRSEDIFKLPLMVHSIAPDYKILLRHFPHNLAWDTDFYFI